MTTPVAIIMGSQSDWETMRHAAETLTALGVRNPDLDALTRSALQDPSVGGNPVAMTYDNTRKLLESIL